MDFEQIKALISLVNSTDVTDLEIQDEDFRVRIRKSPKGAQPVAIQTIETLTAVPPASSASLPAVETMAGLVEISAPMVGTFYRAPAPDAEPFIQVGETISQGQVLFIIEAMKMMNEIESEIKGVVKQILVGNGEPVEYGQPLLLIDPKA